MYKGWASLERNRESIHFYTLFNNEWLLSIGLKRSSGFKRGPLVEVKEESVTRWLKDTSYIRLELLQNEVDL